MTKYPKELGKCIDLCYTLRSERLELEAKCKELKAEQDALEDHILKNFDKQAIGSGRGMVATATVTRAPVPSVTDWDSLWAYIFKTKAIDMLERRASVSACRARWEEGEVIPGVEVYERVGLSLTKVGGK